MNCVQYFSPAARMVAVVGNVDALRLGRVGLLAHRVEEPLEAGRADAEHLRRVVDLERVHDAGRDVREVTRGEGGLGVVRPDRPSTR